MSAGRANIAEILLPYQRRWEQDAAPVKVWEKSRRIGASYGTAGGKVLHAAAAEGGGNVYYISYDKEMTSGFIADCAKWASAFQAAAGAIGEEVLARDDGKDIHTFRIPFPSGNEIKTFSNNPRNLRSKGRPGDKLVVDEAAFVDDLGELLKAALAITMWGGTVEIISTHNGEDSPFNELITDIRAGKYGPAGPNQAASVHRTPIDLALQEGLYQRICQVTGQVWTAAKEAAWLAALEQRYRHNKDEELYCIPRAGGGAYFPRTMLEACMPPAGESGPLLRFDGSREFNAMAEPFRRLEMDAWLRETVDPVLASLDPKRRHVAGMDFARSGDMTDLLIKEIGADLHRTDRALIEMHNVPFAQQRQAVFHIFDRLPRFAGAQLDAGGNGADLAEACADRYGSTLIAQVKFTEATYRDHFPRYKAGIEDRTTTLIRHDDVLEDHRAVQLVRGVPRVPDGKTDAKGQRHGDSAIAGLLADMAASADPPDIGSIAAGGPREAVLAGIEPAAGRLLATGWGAISAGLPE